MADAVTVDQLDLGDHACLTFTDPDERVDLVAEFVADGLERGQRVVCFTDSQPDGLMKELAIRDIAATVAVGRGQLAIHDIGEKLLATGVVSAGQMISAVRAELDTAKTNGFTAVRIAADMCWAIKPMAAAEQLIAFEREAAALFDGGQLMLFCQYDRESFDPVTLAQAAETHPKAVAALAYHDTALLRICRQHRPPGIRISGELDYTNLDPLQQAIAEALRLDKTIYVNLAKLHFIDITAATVIARAAMSLPLGREMVILCSREAAVVFKSIGAAQLPQVRMQSLP
jgi:anti-anti-sigma regulatory factor